MTRLRDEEMDNKTLVLKVREWVSKLCNTGGRAWSLSVPVRMDKDPDMLTEELCKRFESSMGEIEKLQGEIDKLTSLLAEDGGEVKVTEDKIAEYLAFRYEFDNHLMRCITHNLQTMKKDESDEWRVNDFFSHNLHKMFTQSDVASQHTKGEGV